MTVAAASAAGRESGAALRATVPGSRTGRTWTGHLSAVRLRRHGGPNRTDVDRARGGLEDQHMTTAPTPRCPRPRCGGCASAARRRKARRTAPKGRSFRSGPIRAVVPGAGLEPLRVNALTCDDSATSGFQTASASLRPIRGLSNRPRRAPVRPWAHRAITAFVGKPWTRKAGRVRRRYRPPDPPHDPANLRSMKRDRPPGTRARRACFTFRVQLAETCKPFNPRVTLVTR